MIELTSLEDKKELFEARLREFNEVFKDPYQFELKEYVKEQLVCLLKNTVIFNGYSRFLEFYHEKDHNQDFHDGITINLRSSAIEIWKNDHYTELPYRSRKHLKKLLIEYIERNGYDSISF